MVNSINGQARAANAEATENEIAIDLYVAPQNGKASREVVAKWGDLEFTDTINPIQAAARDKFIKRLAKDWNIDDPDELLHVKHLIVDKAKEADALAQQAAQEAAEAAEQAECKPVDRSAEALENTPPEIVAAAKKYLANPKMMEELADDFKKLGIAGETKLACSEYIIGTSRKLDEPLGGTVKSSSASGKSHVTEKAVSLLPEEDVLIATDITPNALYYMAEGSLKHKLVFVGERKHAGAANEADQANATLGLREILSRGRLDKFVPQKAYDGTMVTIQITQEGPIAYLETTTQQEIFEEDATRLLSLTTDESHEQTAAIMAMQANRKAWIAASSDEQEAIKLKHQTAQRMLQPRKVQIPFAPLLTLPTSMVVARRAFPQLLAFIEAVALLRQFQKKNHDDGHIVATDRDYEIAYDLMLPVLNRTFAPVSQRAISLGKTILANVGLDEIFTRADCKEWSGVGITEVRNRLYSLVEAGFVEQVTGGKGVRYSYKLVTTRASVGPSLEGLITPVQLREKLKLKHTQKKRQPHITDYSS